MKIRNYTFAALSIISAVTPLGFTVQASTVQLAQTINVCFVTLDYEGNILTSLPQDSSVSINLYADTQRLVEGQINNYGTQSIPITQTSSSIANTDLTGGGILDGYCVKKDFSNDINQEYTYTQATINSNLDWLLIRYNDEVSINYVHPDIAFPYSTEWFDSVAGNESLRNKNSDGHIVMNSSRLERTVVVVSQLDQNLPTYAVRFNDTIRGNGEYTLSTMPSYLEPGSTTKVRLSVQNMGTLKWLSSLDGTAINPVNVSYHWKNLDDESLSIYNGNRAPLNHNIEYTYNDSNIDLTVNAPNAPGNYQLILDLVHEGVTWFSAQGADTKTFNIQIGEIALPQIPIIVEVQPQARQISSAAATNSVIANYTVQPYTGNPNWHCGGYDCLSGIAEDYYSCSANGIPNDAPNTTDINILSTKCWWPIYIQNKWIWDTYGAPAPYASQPWNYLHPGWILEIPVRGGVVTPPNPPNPPVLTPVVNINTNSGATEADPFAGLLGTWTGWPQVTFDRWIAWDGSWKDDGIKWSETQRPTAPQLTSIITSNDGNSATIYGVGIPKNFPMNIRVWNEFRYCWACGSAWEYFYQQGTAQNVKVVFFKNNWEYLGEVWNDNPSGRFSINLPKGRINPGDQVFAEVQIEADYTFNGLHWWSDTTESRNFNLRDRKYTGYPYFASGGSGALRVPEFYADSRSNEEKNIDFRAMLLGATGASSITNICGYPAKTYSNLKNGAGAIIYVNNRAIFSYGGTWDTFNYYGDKCQRFGVPVNDPVEPAGVGPFNTPGAYQDFQKGRIYWSWKYLGKFIYGEISNKYERLGGTNSIYGWPTGETYTENSNICQNFEAGRICTDNYQPEQGVNYVDFTGVGDGEVLLEPSVEDSIKNTLSSFIDEYGAFMYTPAEPPFDTFDNFGKHAEIMAHYLFGAAKGFVESIVDAIVLVKEIIFDGKLEEVVNGIKSLIEDPNMLGYLIQDQLTEFTNKPFLEKVEVLGDLTANIVLVAAAGYGIAKGAVNLFTKGVTVLKQAIIGGNFGGKLTKFAYGGIEAAITVGKNGLTKIDDIMAAVKGMSWENAKSFVGGLSIASKDKAYILITAAKGNTAKTLLYLIKDKAIFWLEEGTIGSSGKGWLHIVERHIPETATTVGKGTLFPKVALEEIKNSISYVLQNSSAIESQGSWIFESNVIFSDGSSKIVRVVTSYAGEVITAYPLK